MHMVGVCVRGNYRLRIVAKILAHQSFGYLMRKLGSDVFRICKTDYVVYCLDSRLPAIRLGCIIVASAELLINRFHLRKSEVSFSHAVY